ncbi:hypothetical protein E5288_WYG004557 [Bos mutus]|uniref:Uncharacterized protein n=1 Tax=Bos mutus TaxID=72004 RepID=A0A6B0RV09_9CETA|nr:hypothetical protein [Bos mutus]
MQLELELGPRLGFGSHSLIYCIRAPAGLSEGGWSELTVFQREQVCISPCDSMESVILTPEWHTELSGRYYANERDAKPTVNQPLGSDSSPGEEPGHPAIKKRILLWLQSRVIPEENPSYLGGRIRDQDSETDSPYSAPATGAQAPALTREELSGANQLAQRMVMTRKQQLEGYKSTALKRKLFSEK